jgi:hypothetical protein
VVVSVKIISQRDSTDIAERFRERAAEVRSRAAEKIAEDIVNASPVDTGTYIMAHSAQTGDVGGAGRSSKGKMRGQDPQQFRNLALGNLKRSVSKDAILSSSEVFFRNLAEHANHVEYVGWPQHGKQAYYVYTQARSRAPQHIADAARELGMEVR